MCFGGGGGNRTPVRECSTPSVYRLRPKNNLASGRPFGRAAFGQSVCSLARTSTDEGLCQPDEGGVLVQRIRRQPRGRWLSLSSQGVIVIVGS